MRFIATASLGLAATLLVGGCSAENEKQGEPGEGDCARGVLFNGGEYIERGFVEQAGQAIGSGTYATCDDTSEDAQGLEFGDDGEQVEVWSIPDVPSQDAVAVDVEGSYAVLLNEELTDARRAAVLAELDLEG